MQETYEQQRRGNMMAFCKQCGSELENGVKFCPKCGAAVAGNVEVKSASPTPSESRQQAAVKVKSADAGHGLAIGSLVCGIIGIVYGFSDIPASFPSFWASWAWYWPETQRRKETQRESEPQVLSYP